MAGAGADADADALCGLSSMWQTLLRLCLAGAGADADAELQRA